MLLLTYPELYLGIKLTIMNKSNIVGVETNFLKHISVLL
jgi:hypothetical protein